MLGQSAVEHRERTEDERFEIASALCHLHGGATEPREVEENGCSNLHVDTFPNHARKHVNCEWFTPRDANLKSGWAGEAEDKIVELNRGRGSGGSPTMMRSSE